MARKPAGRKQSAAPAKAKKATLGDDAFDWSGAGGAAALDVIASDSEDDDDDEHDSDAGKAGKKRARSDKDGSEEDDEEESESAQDKRIRLAKEYLTKITAQEADGDDDTTGVDERVGARLQQDALEAMGKLFKEVAAQFEDFEFGPESTRFLRGHKLSPTSVCLSDDGKTAFSASKDGAILRWDLATQQKTRLELPKDDVSTAKTDHERCVLALALSSDGKFLASGGRDKLLRVWDAAAAAPRLLETFQGHRDAVSALSFRQRSHMLFSGSLDRCIKHWNLTEMGYVETLFGHQGEVHALDALYRERVVSCGRDRSVRMWKIPEETHLVLYGNSGSLDCVRMINEEYYVTGGDDGALTLWFNGRKKPVHVVRDAHGAGRWISSVAVMPRTDLVASGSSDGVIRLWRADLTGRALVPVAEIPQAGVVNGLCFDPKGRFLVAAVGQEHRLGRWERLKGVKNGLALIALPSVSEDGDDAAEDDDDSDEDDDDDEQEQDEAEEQGSEDDE
ncbi:hypothetical protein P43SY_008989 [Pythium insidiosum]|uniref:U3 small nucleolar RNA-interacting protein n=1 Tax=Pythium insidiosum TaxID=114742 RepID=A0AAD5LF79_PYTIN|nr:hypothetical protein P43SY_008989 [Pythium insidiosum]